MIIGYTVPYEFAYTGRNKSLSCQSSLQQVNPQEYVSMNHLVNCSLIEGCIPDAFKSAVVTPFIKKPNLPSDNLTNYHPVSGLSFISKRVEHVVAEQLLEHIHVHNLDNPYQTSYKPDHSTETAQVCLKVSRIFLILSMKNEPNLFANDFSSTKDGRTVEFDRLNILFNACHNFLPSPQLSLTRSR